MKRFYSVASLFVLIAAVATVQVGCGSSPTAKGENTSKALTGMTKELAKGDKALDATILSLKDLSTGTGDLTKRFDKFDDSVEDLASAAKSIRGEADEIKSEGEKYFKWWEAQVAKVKNEDLKAASTERRQQLRDQFNAISGSMLTVKTQFGPYMSDLRDIQTVLGTGLTPAMVNSIKPVLDRAAGEGAEIRKSMDSLISAYKAVGLEMSAKGGSK